MNIELTDAEFELVKDALGTARATYLKQYDAMREWGNAWQPEKIKYAANAGGMSILLNRLQREYRV